MGCGAIKTSDDKIESSIQENPKKKEDELKKENPNISMNVIEPSNTIENNKDKQNTNNNPPSNSVLPATPQFNKEINFPNSKPIIPLLHSSTINSNTSSLLNLTTISLNQNISQIPTINNINCQTITCGNLEDENGTYIEVKVIASRYEAMYPIWITKDTEVAIEVIGAWKIDNEIEWPKSIVSSESIQSDEIENGALLGKVLGEECYSPLDGKTFMSKLSGPLFLKMNLKSLNSKVEGALTLKMTNVKKIDFNTIDEMIGWPKDINEILISPSSSSYEIPMLEKNVTILINKMRNNASLFAKQYLNGIATLTKSSTELYDKMISTTDTYSKLRFNHDIIESIIAFFSFLLGKSNVTKNKKNAIMNSKEKLELNLKEKHKDKKIHVFIKKHDNDKPLSLAIRALLDEGIRNKIFSCESKEISIITLKGTKMKKFFYFSIIVFSESEEHIFDERLKSKKMEMKKLNTFTTPLESIGEEVELLSKKFRTEQREIKPIELLNTCKSEDLIEKDKDREEGVDIEDVNEILNENQN